MREETGRLRSLSQSKHPSSTCRVDEVLDMKVPIKGHLVLCPGEDDYWPMLAA